MPLPKDAQVITYLKRPERDRLDAFAEERDISRAEAIRTGVLEMLDRADALASELTGQGEVVIVDESLGLG